MPRALCIGKGNFQVNIDNDINIRDMFFPLVGLENHVSGHFCRFGVWVDRIFSWIDALRSKRLTAKYVQNCTHFLVMCRQLCIKKGIS